MQAKLSIKSAAINGFIFLILVSVIRWVANMLAPGQLQLSFDIQSIIAALQSTATSGNYVGLIAIIVSILIVGAAVIYSPEIEKEIPV